jgi:hypothetical protein
MDLTEFRLAGAAGVVVVGLLTTVAAFVVSFVVAGVVRAGLAIAKCVSVSHARDAGESGPTVDPPRGVEQRARLAVAADHALLARQAWWRLRC